MNEHLWAGPQLKLEYALFHFVRMSDCLQPKYDDPMYAVQVAAGVQPSTAWRQVLPAHLDAFLAATRSVPEIIQCCFGHDRYWKLRSWFDALAPDEQDRRHRFSDAFRAHHDAFAALPLCHARDVSFHRAGLPNYAVEVVGAFGATHRGTATQPLPGSEMRDLKDIDPSLHHLIKPRPIEPMWTDFTIDGRPLFESCQRHLDETGRLVANARQIAQAVHGAGALTDPPN